jgi:hypothetical protein
MSQRQQHQIKNPLSKISMQAQYQQPIEISLEFPLYRKNVASDNWRKDITLTRIAEDGSSVSLRYLKSSQYDQETVEFSRGHTAIDTGDLDYTRGVGEHACSEQEFVGMVALGTKLLAQFTQELGPLPSDALDPLFDAVANLKAGNGAGRESVQNRGALRQ